MTQHEDERMRALKVQGKVMEMFGVRSTLGRKKVKRVWI